MAKLNKCNKCKCPCGTFVTNRNSVSHSSIHPSIRFFVSSLIQLVIPFLFVYKLIYDVYLLISFAVAVKERHPCDDELEELSERIGNA